LISQAVRLNNNSEVPWRGPSEPSCAAPPSPYVPHCLPPPAPPSPPSPPPPPSPPLPGPPEGSVDGGLHPFGGECDGRSLSLRSGHSHHHHHHELGTAQDLLYLRVRVEIMGSQKYEKRRVISVSSYHERSHDLHPRIISTRTRIGSLCLGVCTHCDPIAAPVALVPHLAAQDIAGAAWVHELTARGGRWPAVAPGGRCTVQGWCSGARFSGFPRAVRVLLDGDHAKPLASVSQPASQPPRPSRPGARFDVCTGAGEDNGIDYNMD
jgi:hypothetical protein